MNEMPPIEIDKLEMQKENTVDLGLELLLALRRQKATFISEDIAAWTGTTKQYISDVERRAIRKIIKRLRLTVGIQVLNRITINNRFE